ncbi:hypothetical protein [Mycobacterium sp. DL99]|uniref:hypothetical protein n=1 Tax=Mycobacterium sp. DL99 TaxID=2528957 RepID=UPI00108088E5|nr:hypothetical protein [Mycobacterium sp. DL99]
MSDLQSIAVDLTDATARAERDRLASRTDVIDRVGVLRMLPDDMHVTTDMVAEFYQVPLDTIKTVVKRNREELDADGLTVVDRDDFALRFNLNPGRVSAFMLYPRRAVLRVGMLLRDSTVARDVRNYLLNAEQSGEVRRLTPLEYARRLVSAEERVELEHEAREKAEKKLEVEQRHRRAIEAGDGIHLTDFGKKYFSEVPARKFEEHLYSRGYLINQHNTRVRADGSIRDGYDHRKPTAKGRPYIYDHDQGNYGGRRRFQPRVRPQMEIALRDALAAEGLPVNEHSTGLIIVSRDQLELTK